MNVSPAGPAADRLIRNPRDLAEVLGAEHATEASLSRRIYRETACGAWLALQKVPTRVFYSIYTAHLTRGINGIHVTRVRPAHGRTCRPESLPEAARDFLCLGPETSLTSIPVETWEGLAADRQQNLLRVTPTGPLERVVTFRVRRQETRNGIALGSIVEGIDPCVGPYTLAFPFTEEAFDTLVARVESEVSDLWRETHGCPDCDPEAGEEMRPVNPDCPTCHGEGVPC